jgi:hypothetical protein
LCASTQEIVDAALAGASWQDDAAENVHVQTWASAARQLESLVAQAESKLSYSNLHARVLELSACEVMHDPSLLKLARRKLLESYLIRGGRAWLSFAPGTHPPQRVRRIMQAATDAILKIRDWIPTARVSAVRKSEPGQHNCNASNGPAELDVPSVGPRAEHRCSERRGEKVR